MVTVKVADSTDNGATFTYKNIPGSPFTIQIGKLDLTEYESYDNLVVGGFGITSLSLFTSITTPPIAGDPFTIQLDPRNTYNSQFTYFENEGKYFITDFSKVLSPPGTKPQCMCGSVSQRYCHFYSNSKPNCLAMVGLCVWRHESIFATFKPNIYSCVPCAEGCDDY